MAGPVLIGRAKDNNRVGGLIPYLVDVGGFHSTIVDGTIIFMDHDIDKVISNTDPQNGHSICLWTGPDQSGDTDAGAAIQPCLNTFQSKFEQTRRIPCKANDYLKLDQIHYIFQINKGNTF